VLVRGHGAPSTAEAFIFAPGAIAGSNLIGLLDLLAAKPRGPIKPINRCRDRVLAGVFDWVAVGAALGARPREVSSVVAPASRPNAQPHIG
jgi:hypothetical protein